MHHAAAPHPLPLGLAPEHTEKHIAFDIGALSLAGAIADRLNASLIYGKYSRLVVDLNRYPDDHTSMAAVSDDIEVPGNANITERARQARLDSIFHPYHNAIADHLDELWQRRIVPIMILVHSFTPSFGNSNRPWPVGILWNSDGRLALPLMRELSEAHGLNVGDNQPYSGQHPYSYSSVDHCKRREIRHVVIEVRQDLLQSDAQINEWAGVLSSSLTRTIAQLESEAMANET